VHKRTRLYTGVPFGSPRASIVREFIDLAQPRDLSSSTSCACDVGRRKLPEEDRGQAEHVVRRELPEEDRGQAEHVVRCELPEEDRGQVEHVVRRELPEEDRGQAEHVVRRELPEEEHTLHIF
jgi:hypothetical protein